MNGLAPRRRRAAEFAQLADLAVDRPGADVAKQLAEDEESAQLVSITQALRELESAAGPDPQFRARLRQRLVAHATVTAPAGGTARTPVVPAPRGGRTQRLGGRAGSPRLAFLAGTLAALVLISGLTLLASNNAVPGDSLYAIKRSSENLELALLHNPQDRGERKLSFARERLQEINSLVARNGSPAGGSTGTGTFGSADTNQMLAALKDMDRSTGEGAALLTGLAVQKQSAQLLAELDAWANGQLTSLTTLRQRMPGEAAQRATGSITLLNRLSFRLAELRAALGCTGCLQDPVLDDLGPIPHCLTCAGTGTPGAPRSNGATPPPGSTSGPGGRSPDPVQTTGPGTSLPTGSAPPPPATVGPAGVPGIPLGTGGPLPTASGLPSPSPDVVCRVLGSLCRK
jgi:hypothetical protein